MQAGGSSAMDVDDGLQFEEWVGFLLDPDEPLPNNLGMVLPRVLPVVTPAPTRRVHFDYAAMPFAMGEHETPEQYQPGEPPPPPPNPPRLQQPPPPQQRPPLQQRPFTFEQQHPTPQGTQGPGVRSSQGAGGIGYAIERWAWRDRRCKLEAGSRAMAVGRCTCARHSGSALCSAAVVHTVLV